MNSGAASSHLNSNNEMRFSPADRKPDSHIFLFLEDDLSTALKFDCNGPDLFNTLIKKKVD